MQLNFFRKGLKSLEAVDTHVRSVAERQHIDYQFSGLEDDEVEDGEDSYYSNEAGELSFDYRQNKQGHDVVSTSRNSLEVRICVIENLLCLSYLVLKVSSMLSYANFSHL